MKKRTNLFLPLIAAFGMTLPLACSSESNAGLSDDIEDAMDDAQDAVEDGADAIEDATDGN